MSLLEGHGKSLELNKYPSHIIPHPTRLYFVCFESIACIGVRSQTVEASMTWSGLAGAALVCVPSENFVHYVRVGVGSLDIHIEIEGAGEDETEHLITEVTIRRHP